MGIPTGPRTLGSDGVFWHRCETVGCDREVEFDDEPWCFTHSPDEGSSKIGYSARLKAFTSGKALDKPEEVEF